MKYQQNVFVRFFLILSVLPIKNCLPGVFNGFNSCCLIRHISVSFQFETDIPILKTYYQKCTIYRLEFNRLKRCF